MGDAAGVGPELIVRAWKFPRLHATARLVVVGSAKRLEREIRNSGKPISVVRMSDPGEVAATLDSIPCIDIREPEVADCILGTLQADCARAAFNYLIRAIDLTKAGAADGIVTLPLNKEGLYAAGLHYPGHTEILAERCCVHDFGMMLYRRGLGVLHTTLHMSLREVFAVLTTERIHTTIVLLDGMMRRLGVSQPRVAVAALNPHAGDGGIFGDEEPRIIVPAVQAAQRAGLNVVGPLPTDTLFSRAKEGAFDGVVAMYHDQGHIALKVLGWREAVNITVGLPIVRTSVAHGTAYDIVGKNLADPTSLFEAVEVAAQLCKGN